MPAAGCGIFEAAWDRDGAGGLLGGQPHRALSGKVVGVMIRVRAQDRQGLQAVPPQTSAEESILGGAPEEESQPPGTWHASPYEVSKDLLSSYSASPAPSTGEA